jgi:hypothetical protein
MAAWNKVLSKLKAPDNPDQQHKDAKQVLRVSKSGCGSDHSKGREALQADRSGRDGAIVDRVNTATAQTMSQAIQQAQVSSFITRGFSGLPRDCA